MSLLFAFDRLGTRPPLATMYRKLIKKGGVQVVPICEIYY